MKGLLRCNVVRNMEDKAPRQKKMKNKKSRIKRKRNKNKGNISGLKYPERVNHGDNEERALWRQIREQVGHFCVRDYKLYHLHVIALSSPSISFVSIFYVDFLTPAVFYSSPTFIV